MNTLTGWQIGRIGRVLIYTLVLLMIFLNVYYVSSLKLQILSTFLIVVLVVADITPYLSYRIFNYIRGTVSEFFAVIACIILLPFRQTRFDPHTIEDVDQVPILLIHGYLFNSSVWLYHRYHYRREGLKNVFTVDLGSPFQSIESYAEVVRKRVQDIKKITGKDQIRLVGHSMGGLVAAYYTLNLSKQDSIVVTDLVTLATPFFGTILAKIGIGECAVQMRFGSPFVRKLMRKLEKSAIRCFHQGSEVDLIVVPSRSSFTRRRGHFKIKTYSDLGHAVFLFSDRVISNTIIYLKGVTE